MKLFNNIQKKSIFSFNPIKNSKIITEPTVDFIEGVPYINSMYNYSQALILTTQPENYKNILNNYVKSCPELIDLTQAVIFDMMSDGYYFVPETSDTKEKKIGKERIKKAEKWCLENNFNQGLEDGLFDYLVLGNVAWWYNIDSNSSRENISKMIDSHNKFNKDKIKIKEVIIDDEIEIRLK